MSEPCGHVYEGSEPGTICDSCSRMHKAAEWLTEVGILEPRAADAPPEPYTVEEDQRDPPLPSDRCRLPSEKRLK